MPPREEVVAGVAEGDPQVREEAEAETGHLLVGLVEVEDLG